MKIPNEIVSLDLEMSGSLANGGTILSIGIYHPKTQTTFYEEARHDFLVVEPEASRVHGLNMRELDIVQIADRDRSIYKVTQDRKRLSIIDKECREWLQYNTGIVKQNQLIALGFGIAKYDMSFVEKFLPKTYGQFSNKTVDLNSLSIAADCKHDRELGETKEITKQLAHLKNEYPHNALSDAIWSWKVFKELIGE